jgi:hypothetical protein
MHAPICMRDISVWAAPDENCPETKALRARTCTPVRLGHDLALAKA